jgi:hypothetical protein
MNYTCCLRR